MIVPPLKNEDYDEPYVAKKFFDHLNYLSIVVNDHMECRYHCWLHLFANALVAGFLAYLKYWNSE